MHAVTNGAEVLWAYYWPPLDYKGTHEAAQQPVNKINRHAPSKSGSPQSDPSKQ